MSFWRNETVKTKHRVIFLAGAAQAFLIKRMFRSGLYLYFMLGALIMGEIQVKVRCFQIF